MPMNKPTISYVIRLKRLKSIYCRDKMWGYWFENKALNGRGDLMKKVYVYPSYKLAARVLKRGELDGGEGSPSNMDDETEVVSLAIALNDLVTKGAAHGAVSGGLPGNGRR